jgi:hypothetical protein
MPRSAASAVEALLPANVFALLQDLVRLIRQLVTLLEEHRL